MNDFIWLYRVGLPNPVKIINIEEQSKGTTFYQVPDGGIGYYYASYIHGGKLNIKNSNIANANTFHDSISIEGQIVSGKCKITWMTNYVTTMDQIEIRIGSITQYPEYLPALYKT